MAAAGKPGLPPDSPPQACSCPNVPSSSANNAMRLSKATGFSRQEFAPAA